MNNYKNPFIKVIWEDSPENINQEKIKRVKEYFKIKYNTTNVRIEPKYIINNSNSNLKSLDCNDNISDFQYQKKLIKDFIQENNIEIKWDLIDRLDNKVNLEIKNKVNKSNKWFIKKIEFSNFLSFGDGNMIDFTELDGISVIESEPRNFGGKTTISVDLIMFLFFNKTTKTEVISDIFNKFKDCNELKVKGYLEIDGEDYILERIITRKLSKSGEYNSKSTLNYYKMINDEIIDLNEDQRTSTEKIITNSIGNEKDFLLTILTTGSNLEEIIDSKPTARGQILTRFLGLELLKEKEDICKLNYSNWSKKSVSNSYNKVSLLNNNEELSKKNEEYKLLNDNLSHELKDSESLLNEHELDRENFLKLRNNDINDELFKVNPESIQKEIDILILEQNKINDNIKIINVVDPKEYYNEDEHEIIKNKIKDIDIKISNGNLNLKNKNNILTQLENSLFCPVCKQSIKDVDHTEEIKNIKIEISKFEDEIKNLESQKIKQSEKEVKFSNLKKEYDLYEREKLRKEKYQLEYSQKELEITNKKNKIKEYNSNKKKLDDNKIIDNELVILKVKIETEKGNIKSYNESILKNDNYIKNNKEKIIDNNALIEKIKIEEEIDKTFNVYLNIFGKNGISKTIMKNMIPLLNEELNRLMSDSCYFTLELSINDKNEVEFIMIDNETRISKSLNSGSGYERTISSLAIRSVLAKISSLPKPNIIVMDEVFGKIADENLEMVGEFFKKIKTYFEHIILISHNPLIRNWSDNLIMIKKEENISSIDYINNKLN